jgi:hypothetical protein
MIFLLQPMLQYDYLWVVIYCPQRPLVIFFPGVCENNALPPMSIQTHYYVPLGLTLVHNFTESFGTEKRNSASE